MEFCVAFGKTEKNKTKYAVLRKSWIIDFEKIKVGNLLVSYYNDDIKVVDFDKVSCLDNYSRHFSGESDSCYRFVLQSTHGNEIFMF